MSCITKLSHYPLIRLAWPVFLFNDTYCIVVQINAILIRLEHLQKCILERHTMAYTKYYTSLFRSSV